MGRDPDTDSSRAHTRPIPADRGSDPRHRTWSMLWTRDGDVTLGGFGGGYEWEAGGRATRAVRRARDGQPRPTRIADAGSTRCTPRGGAGAHGRARVSRRLGQPGGDGDRRGVGQGRAPRRRLRAQYARPVALLLRAPAPGRERLRDGRASARRHYGARVLCLPDRAQVVAWCERRKLGLAEGTVGRCCRSRRPSRLTRFPRQPRCPRAVARSAADCASCGRSGGRTESSMPSGCWLVASSGSSTSRSSPCSCSGSLPRSSAGSRTKTSGDAPAPTRRRRAARWHVERSLRVVDEELVSEGKARWLYAAEVRNAGDRAAIGVNCQQDGCSTTGASGWNPSTSRSPSKAGRTWRRTDRRRLGCDPAARTRASSARIGRRANGRNRRFLEARRRSEPGAGGSKRCEV